MRRLGLRDQRGLGLIEIALVLVIVAIVGTLLYRYVGSTAKQVEKFKEDRPLAHARLAADQATLASMQQALQTYKSESGRTTSGTTLGDLLKEQIKPE